MSVCTHHSAAAAIAIVLRFSCVSGFFRRFKGVDAVRKRDKRKRLKKEAFPCVSVESDYIIFVFFGI